LQIMILNHSCFKISAIAIVPTCCYVNIANFSMTPLWPPCCQRWVSSMASALSTPRPLWLSCTRTLRTLSMWTCSTRTRLTLIRLCLSHYLVRYCFVKDYQFEMTLFIKQCLMKITNTNLFYISFYSLTV